MSCVGRGIAVSVGFRGWLPLALAQLAAVAAIAIAPTTARGNTGYELSTGTPVLVAGIEFAHGVAVDQVSHRVYVAVVTNDAHQPGVPGEIRRFESNGTPAGSFTVGSNGVFSGVAVNPVTQGFYASQVRTEPPFGEFGVHQMSPFSSTGVLGTPFPLANTKLLPQIATDSNGDVYFPNAAADSVQVFNTAGALQETIVCSGCPGGSFGQPASVAIDSEDNLYVVDFDPDRVIKFALSGGSYVFDSLLQSGRGAAAVGVDPSTDDVFVGDFPNGANYHVVAYDSSGVQFDDFGAGLFINPPIGISAVAQIAADATSHRLYFTETNKIYVFERVTISPPSVTTNAASAIVQLSASLNATVNANGHATLECDFEYVDDAEFLANGFANALEAPCSKKPDGTGNTAVSANVAGLSPGTKYRYRAVAESNAGSTTGNERTLTTLPSVPPTVTTTAATSVVQTAATLNGTVNPHGGNVTDCHFDFGTSAAYGSSVPCASAVGPATAAVAQKANASGLAGGGTYHFRLVVTSNAGTTEGSGMTFSTPSPPVTPPPPAPSPPEPPQTPPQPTPPPPLTCKAGFTKLRVGGKSVCVRKCRKGTVRRRIGGKFKCLKQRQKRRANRRQPAPAGRR